MKFQDYLIESWKDYKVSNSPKVLLYDFYLLSYLSSLILDPGTRKDVGLTGVGYSGKFFGREGQELDEDIQNAQRKLLPFLGNKLSQALFLAICAELRHALDRNQQWDKFKHTNNKTFKKYIRNLRLMSDNDLKAFQSKRNLENPELEVSTKGYKTSYQAAKKAITETGGDVVTFARMAADAFTDLNWSASYGGKAWTDIAQGYIDLRIALNNYNPEAPSPSSESAEKLIAAIDHAFDLEHNTGTVLNKVKYFSVGGDYNWIATALDDKRDADMYSIASKASSDMRKLGLEVLKVAGIQDKQLKKVPAEAGIPTKKIKLAGFTSKKNEGKTIQVGDIVKMQELGYKEVFAKVIKINNNTGEDMYNVMVTSSKEPNISVGTIFYNQTYEHLEKLSDKSVPAEAGIPTKKIKLSGFTSIENPSSLPIGSIVENGTDQFAGQVTDVDDSLKTVKVKIIGVKVQDNKKYLGAVFEYSFKSIKSFKIVNKQNVSNVLADYMVDPEYKPSKFTPWNIKSETIKDPSSLPIGSLLTDEFSQYVSKVIDVNDEKSVVTIKFVAVNQKDDKKWLGKNHEYGYNYIKKLHLVKKQDEAVILNNFWLAPGFKPEATNTSSELKIGDTVKVKNNDIEGTVELINQGMIDPIVQINVTKAKHDGLVGVKTWYLAGDLEKISPSNVVKLQGFGGKKPAKIDPDPLSLSTRIDMPFMLTIGSILINTRSSDLYIVQMVNGPEDYIKIKLVASNDALDFPNYTEPELYNGATIAEDFRVIENEDKKEVFASYEFIDLSTASRKASKAAKADEPAPRERDENLKVGSYFVISNETIIVMITGLPRGYVEYKVVAGDKKHRMMVGADSGMPKDMFIDSINFALNPGWVTNYIRQFKKKPGSR